MRVKKEPQRPEYLFKSQLDPILKTGHPLNRLANSIDRDYFKRECGPFYVRNKGCPGKLFRLFVVLHYLKHAFDESDESVVDRFLDNPYRQYFCGLEYFQHEIPINPASIVKWRQPDSRSKRDAWITYLLRPMGIMF